MDDLHFFIIATGYNCAEKVKPCIDSVKKQTYKNYTAVFIDDGSDDATGTEIVNRTQKANKLQAVPFFENKGAAFRRYDILKSNLVQPDSVVLLLGLDDELLPNCLERIKQEYDNGAWMTYGNWIGSDGYTLPDGFLDFPQSIHEMRYYRSVRYRSTAPNTFRAHLFDHFTEDDFKFRGEWIKATTESNLMISLLEMCGQSRIGVIKEPIYLYNIGRVDNARRRFGSAYQDSIYRDVKKRKPRELI